MSLFFKLSFIVLFCGVFCHRVRVPSEENNYDLLAKVVRADQPLNVSVLKIGDRFVILNITGSDIVDNLPVTQLFINYTTDGSKVEIKSEILSTTAENGMFQKTVKIVGLNPGHTYNLQISAENKNKQLGPPSRVVTVLLLPPTPDITVLHPVINKLKVIWGERRTPGVDYFLLTVEKKSALGCGMTVNLTSCFGKSYTLDDLEVGQVYRLSMVSHNPTGFSDPVVVSYPIE